METENPKEEKKKEKFCPFQQGIPTKCGDWCSLYWNENYNCSISAISGFAAAVAVKLIKERRKENET